MIPAELYQTIYKNVMLVIVLATAIAYSSSVRFNRVIDVVNRHGLWLTACGLTLMLGGRPLSGVFVDMTTYAWSYIATSVTGQSEFPDIVFALFVKVCAYDLRLSTAAFFFLCAVVYVLPIAFAMRRCHGIWAFAPFLACAGSMSFFAYGVNGIRNGMASSVLLAAMAMRDRHILMCLLIAVACGVHGSIILPALAFIIAARLNKKNVGWSIWVGALAISIAAGPQLGQFIAGMSIIGVDERFAHYATSIGDDQGGFRWDFVIYSIAPIAASLMLSDPRARTDKLYLRLLNTYLIANAVWLCLMHVAFSNRFAYLSWFLMPWVVVYVHLPMRTEGRKSPTGGLHPSKASLLGLILVGHYAFTYFIFM